MYNYSARPWMAIGLFLLLLCGMFYIRTPHANGPLDIIPLWIIIVILSAFSFFAAAYIVDHLMIFPSKYMLHEVYQFQQTVSNPVYETAPRQDISSEEIEFTFQEPPFSEELDQHSSTSTSTSSSSSTGSATSSLSSLRPRSDANKFMMY